MFTNSKDVVCARAPVTMPSRVLPVPQNQDSRRLLGFPGQPWRAPSVVKWGDDALEEAELVLPPQHSRDEEGIYVPPRPFVTKENWRRFQLRVARERVYEEQKAKSAGAAKPDATDYEVSDGLPEAGGTKDMPDHLAAGELLPHIGDPVEPHHLRLDSGPGLHQYGSHAAHDR